MSDAPLTALLVAVPAAAYSPKCPTADKIEESLPQGNSQCTIPTVGCGYVSAGLGAWLAGRLLPSPRIARC